MELYHSETPSLKTGWNQRMEEDGCIPVGAAMAQAIEDARSLSLLPSDRVNRSQTRAKQIAGARDLCARRSWIFCYFFFLRRGAATLSPTQTAAAARLFRGIAPGPCARGLPFLSGTPPRRRTSFRLMPLNGGGASPPLVNSLLLRPAEDAARLSRRAIRITASSMFTRSRPLRRAPCRRSARSTTSHSSGEKSNLTTTSFEFFPAFDIAVLPGDHLDTPAGRGRRRSARGV
jgi:hypothetical protein